MGNGRVDLQFAGLAYFQRHQESLGLAEREALATTVEQLRQAADDPLLQQRCAALLATLNQ